MNVMPDMKGMIPVRLSPGGGCNTVDDIIIDQVSQNIRRGLPQAKPMEARGSVILACGGPSLAANEKALVQAIWGGAKVVAVNGAYRWCMERNIKPSMAVMIDAREFNARFFEEPVDGCKYFLASQCHPRAFEFCRGRDLYIWHVVGCTDSDRELAVLDGYYFSRKNYWPVDLGTTVAIRAISLLRMLGFVRMDIFGLDSCFVGEQHHSYPQPENDADKRMKVWLRPDGQEATSFTCAPWHIKQADDFMWLIRERGNLFQLSVRGDGLIATMLRNAADIIVEEGADQ